MRTQSGTQSGTRRTYGGTQGGSRRTSGGTQGGTRRTHGGTQGGTRSRTEGGGRNGNRGREPIESKSSTEGKRRSLPTAPLIGAGALVLLGLWAAASTESGRKASAYAFVILDFFAGVIILVTLSLAVMAGVFATDRTILQIRHRVMLQAFHRAMSVIAVSFLGVHIAVKVLGGRAGLLDALVPFASPQFSVYVGFGTIASYLLMIAFWTGIARARFAGKSRPWLWRTLHSSAYVSWPVALVHGLNAGRPGDTWVIVSYVLCIGAVVIALLVRLYVTFGRRPSGVRTGTPAIGVNNQTIAIPRFRDPVAATAGISAPPRTTDREIDDQAYARPGGARPAGPAGPPAPLPPQPPQPPQPRAPRRENRGRQPDRWEEQPDERWAGPPERPRSGQPAPAARWDDRRPVEFDPPEQEPGRPRLRLVENDEEPPAENPYPDPYHGRTGSQPRVGYQEERPGPYPPAYPGGRRADRSDGRGSVERPERRRRGRRVAGDDVIVDYHLNW